MKKLKKIESDIDATELYVLYYSEETGKCIAPTPKKKKVRDTITYTTSDNSMITSDWFNNYADNVISHTYEDGVGTIVLDIDNITDMSGMFSFCSNLTSIDLSSLDTSNVTYMSAMFGECTSLTSINLQGIDTSNVTIMHNMFAYCSSLTSIDLSSLDTSNVINMSWMFSYCSSLTSITYNNIEYTVKSDLIAAIGEKVNTNYMLEGTLLS